MRHACFLVVLALVGPLLAAEPETVWRMDFDSADETGGVHYVVRDGKDASDRMTFEIADGVLTFGAEFDGNSAGHDHGVLAWGESMPWGFWQWKPSPFQKIDASKYPIVELRARQAPGFDAAVTLAPTFDTDSGRKFAQLGLRLCAEWQTYAFRLSPFSSVTSTSYGCHSVRHSVPSCPSVALSAASQSTRRELLVAGLPSATFSSVAATPSSSYSGAVQARASATCVSDAVTSHSCSLSRSAHTCDGSRRS